MTTSKEIRNEPEEIRFEWWLNHLLITMYDNQKSFPINYKPNGKYLSLMTVFLRSVDKFQLIESFISHTHEKYWTHVFHRDVDCINFNELLPYLDEIKDEDIPIVNKDDIVKCIELLYSAFKDEIFNAKQREYIWNVLFSLVKIAIRYVKKHPEKYPDIDIDTHMDLWNIM